MLAYAQVQGDRDARVGAQPRATERDRGGAWQRRALGYSYKTRQALGNFPSYTRAFVFTYSLTYSLT